VDNKERFNALDKDAMDLFRKKKPEIKIMVVNTLRKILQDGLNDIIEKPAGILKRLSEYHDKNFDD
jgi:hypothetical protein